MTKKYIDKLIEHHFIIIRNKPVRTVFENHHRIHSNDLMYK